MARLPFPQVDRPNGEWHRAETTVKGTVAINCRLCNALLSVDIANAEKVSPGVFRWVDVRCAPCDVLYTVELTQAADGYCHPLTVERSESISTIRSFWDCPNHVYDEYWNSESKEEVREYLCSREPNGSQCMNCPSRADGSFNPYGKPLPAR